MVSEKPYPEYKFGKSYPETQTILLTFFGWNFPFGIFWLGVFRFKFSGQGFPGFNFDSSRILDPVNFSHSSAQSVPVAECLARLLVHFVDEVFAIPNHFEQVLQFLR